MQPGDASAFAVFRVQLVFYVYCQFHDTPVVLIAAGASAVARAVDGRHRPPSRENPVLGLVGRADILASCGNVG